MKPKYYSCFFLSLFACDQGNIQDTDRKDNLLDGPASTELINNFCQKVKDINDENDPSACVESINKLVGKYANNFWSLERCQGIFKQLCEQVPSYPSQIVYDVLYALVKNKCLGAAGVRTIIQGIEENNPKVFSLLNNYVCLNRSRVNETDEPDRIIAESFGFILNKTISISGINTFTSTPIPQQKKEITIDDLTNIWQCVRFIINNNGFDTNSLKKLIKLASSEDFNEAIKAIADAGIFFKDSGDEMMNAFDGENVNLNDAGLQALANCIQDTNKIATTNNVLYLFPSLKNCTDLAPIFKKCEKAVTVDEFIKLLDNIINLNSVISLDPLVASLQDGKFNLDCLKKLTEKYNNKSDKFNKVLSKISGEKFDTSAKGDDVIQAFEGKKIELEDRNLTKVLLMISAKELISNCEKAIYFCDENITNPNESNIEAVFNKGENEIFKLNVLESLLTSRKYTALNKILPHIPDEKLCHQHKGKKLITIIINHQDNLEANTIHKVLLMIDDRQKIVEKQNTTVFKLCCNKQGLDINKFIRKCIDFKFTLDCLDVYKKKDNHDQFNTVLAAIPDENFETKNNGDVVVKKFQNNDIEVTKGNVRRILLLCQDGKKITNVTCLYFVFSRSYDDKEGVKALIALVEDNSLNGNSVIWQIDTTKTYTTDTQKDFVKKFYGKIRDNTIYLFDQNIAKKFVLFTYIWYKQDDQLIYLEKKMKKNNKKEPYDYDKLIPNKTILQNVGCETDEDFTAFKTALNTALDKK